MALRTARSALLDRFAHQRTVLGPRAVVVPDVGVSEELVEHEPRVRRALADPAVRDDRPVRRDARAFVQGAELIGGPERPVLVGGLAPRDVGRARDVSGDLGLLLREVRAGRGPRPGTPPASAR